MVFGIWAVVARFGRAIRRGISEPEFRGLLTLVAMLVGAATWFYRVVEGWGWVDSLYFSVITLTTVGYGDLSPSAAGSKLFTVALVLVGIGVLLTFVERIARYATQDAAERRDEGRQG